MEEPVTKCLVKANSSLRSSFATKYTKKYQDVELALTEKVGKSAKIGLFEQISDKCMYLAKFDPEHWDKIVEVLQETFPDYGITITPNYTFHRIK